MMKKINSIFIFLFLLVNINSKEIVLLSSRYSVNIPEGWIQMQSSQKNKVGFTNQNQDVVFQIEVNNADVYKDGFEICNAFKTRVGGSGDIAEFDYFTNHSVFADLTLNKNNKKLRGYGLFINGEHADVTLFAFTQEDNFEQAQDYILSCLDSFAVYPDQNKKKGPIGQFYIGPNANNYEVFPISFRGMFLNTYLNLKSIDSSNMLVEREARILYTYNQGWENAWTRYYRLIYKDVYKTLEPVYVSIKKIFDSNGIKSDEAVAKNLLMWLQYYKFKRTQETLSDFSVPLQCIVERAGDCDSLALVYNILLDYFGIDSVLMLSRKHSHSMAAVDIPGQGARVQANNKNYLVAEMTDQIEIGLIDQKMSDPKDWLIVSYN